MPRPRPSPPPEPSFDEASGLLRIVASVEMPDFDDEVVIPSTIRLDEYRLNPVVLFGHDQDRFPVGTCERVDLDAAGRLVQEWRFATTAEGRDVERLYREKVLRGASIGFKPDGYRRISADEAYRRYGVRKPLKVCLGGTLKETSAVPVPCCPAALADGWVSRPAVALRVAAAGNLAGKPLSGLVCKALRGLLARQAHARPTLHAATRSAPVSATATTGSTKTKAMDTLDATAGGSTVDTAAASGEEAPEAVGHNDAISANNRASGHALLDAMFDGEIDDKTFHRKLKTLVRAHGDLTNDGAAADTADTGDDDEDGDEDLETKDGDEDEDEDDAFEAKAIAGGLITKSMGRHILAEIDSLRELIAGKADQADVDEVRADLDAVTDTLGEVV